MQHQLFEKGSSSKHKSLIISKAGKQKLSKNQEAFNKLTQKIEKLQKDIEKKQIQFDLALKIYGTELLAAQKILLEASYKLITVLWNIYKDKKLSKTDQRHLKNVLQYQLQEYFIQSATEPDEELQKIFSAIEGISYDKMMQAEKESMTAAMQEIFSEADVDIEGLDMEDEKAIAEKMAEAKQKIAERQEQEEERERQRQKNKKKTARQAEYEKMQEAATEMKQKNISTIYKQLAKLFHPDLEQDTDRKAEKEILMKELTAAYEAKNLHALLSLELKWIHKENDHLESLTEDKLAIYLQILKEQVRELEYEKISIAQQPQYYVLTNEFGFSIQRSPVEIVKQHVEAAKKETIEIKKDTADFESDTALRHIKEMIKQWKENNQKLDEEEEILRMLFG